MLANRLITARTLFIVVSLLFAQLANAQDSAWVDGITASINDVTMSSPVVGIVGARPVEEGTFVKKGQVMVQFDKALEELEVSRKTLFKELAKTELDRTKTLVERSAISVTREELDKKRGDFDIASVELELARELLKRRMLVAPFDGFVSEIFLQIGEACEVRQPVVRLVDTRRCYFIANIEAKTGHALKTGDKLKLNLESGPSPIEVEGTISLLSPVVDPSSGLMRIKLIFENPEGKIRPGVAGRMQLPGSTRTAKR
jgi:membrane fusion protein, multidrug efflux system